MTAENAAAAGGGGFNKIMKKHNISVLFGNDTDYFEKFDIWLHNS